MSPTVFIVGCGKSKLDHAAPARELYTGSLFRASLRLAESQEHHAVFIASARYGIITRRTVLEPYDDTLTSHRKDERMAWGQRAAHHLRLLYPAGAVRLVILAGETYADPIEYGLRWYAGERQTRWTVEQPLRGLGLGARLRRLAELTAGAAKEAA